MRGVTPSPPQSLPYERRLDEPFARGIQSGIDSAAVTMVASFLATQQVVARSVVLFTLYSCHFCCCLVFCGGEGEEGLRAHVRTLTTRVCCVVSDRFPTHMAIDTGASYCKSWEQTIVTSRTIKNTRKLPLFHKLPI